MGFISASPTRLPAIGMGGQVKPIILKECDFPKVIPEKWCSQCRKYKVVDEFYSNKARDDGLGVYCKKCSNRNRVARYRKKRLPPKHQLLDDEDKRGTKKPVK